jgi:hypothetical protein
VQDVSANGQNMPYSRPKYALNHMIEMNGDNAKRQMTPHGMDRCQPVGLSLILLGEVLTAP